MYLSDNDEITMKLVHYFVTKENYQPIIVNGAENEIWLENIDKPYAVIRINANYIHNNDQLQYDLFRSKSIIKQIKRKTFSLTCDMLNIQINLLNKNSNELDNTLRNKNCENIQIINELSNHSINFT